MGEMQENFLNSDPDATLVQPRFDEAEAQTARPVVPLTRAPVWQSRRLPLALVLVSALLGGLVSVVAYRLYLRPARTQTATQAQQTKTEAETAATPAPQASHTPELTAAAPAKDETARAETPAASKPEERAPAAETRAAKDEAKDEEKLARAEANAKRSDDERAAREASARRDNSRAVREEPPRARRVEVIPAYPEADRVGHDRRRDDDGEARDYQLPPDGRDGRRWGGRRARRRNIDRIRDIFGAPPPG
jgi:hypothetical protein